MMLNCHTFGIRDGIVLMSRTPFYRTSKELKHHFLNIERTRTYSFIGDRTRTPNFWLRTFKHPTLNIVWTKVGRILLWTSHFGRLAVCLDGPFLNVYTFSSFLCKKDHRQIGVWTRAARSTGHRANHYATADSCILGLKVTDLSKISISKMDHLNKLVEVSWFLSKLFRFGPYKN